MKTFELFLSKQTKEDNPFRRWVALVVALTLWGLWDCRLVFVTEGDLTVAESFRQTRIFENYYRARGETLDLKSFDSKALQPSSILRTLVQVDRDSRLYRVSLCPLHGRPCTCVPTQCAQ